MRGKRNELVISVIESLLRYIRVCLGIIDLSFTRLCRVEIIQTMALTSRNWHFTESAYIPGGIQCGPGIEESVGWNDDHLQGRLRRYMRQKVQVCKCFDNQRGRRFGDFVFVYLMLLLLLCFVFPFGHYGA